jgi:hypothetical protein
MDELPSRVAVLEQMARDTEATLADIRSEVRELRGETRAELREIRGEIRDLRNAARSDFHWLLGIVLSSIGITIGGFITLVVTILHH